jgi:type VI secretion system secreted protein VgrG
MSQSSRTTFYLEADPLAPADVAVTGFRGTEALSEPFSFELDFHRHDDEAIEIADLVGAEALLTVRAPDLPDRFVHGFLDHVELVADRPRRPSCRGRLVPQLRRLECVRGSRIFQNLSVPQIAKQVLDAGKVEQRWSIQGSYPARDFCVQYRESDLAFAQRLLEEEGIFYFFEHRQDGHVMVLGDGSSAYVPLPGGPKLPFRFKTGRVAGAEHIDALVSEERVAPGATALRDFDFERPALDLTASATSEQGSPDLEWYDYPGLYLDPGEGKRLSRTRLEELRAVHRTRRGESTCRPLAPGFELEVEDHPDPSFNGKLVAVRVEHAGRSQGSADEAVALDRYRNVFVAVDTATPFRPARRTPRPLIPGVQTATVVGPEGEEIFPDRYGRVKVRFHWDREGSRDDRCSCWVRLGQTWAGAGFGACFIPRVGQEVLVRFLEGNPDRPIVVGAVYNGTHPPPVALPVEKTKSTVRSDSSPGSGGANELRIEDTAGSEEVFIHAQKDNAIEILNDKSQSVGKDESLSVAKDRSREVGGNQDLRVDQEDTTGVQGNGMLLVLGNRSTQVGGNHSESVTAMQGVTVSGTQSVKVTLASSMFVGAAAALTVGGAYAINVGGVVNHAVAGLQSSQVGGAKVEVVGASRSEVVMGDSSASVGADFDSSVDGSASVGVEKDLDEDVSGKAEFTVKDGVGWTAKSFKLEADSLSVMVNGELRLRVEKSGRIQLFGSKLTIDASGDVVLNGATLKMEGS